MSATPVSTATAAGSRGMKWVLLSVLVAASATVALSAWAQPHGGRGMFDGPGMMGPGMMAGRGIDHMLDGLNASEAQRTQIRQIADAARKDLQAQREAGRALHDRAAQIFTAPNVDAVAAESVRQQMLQQHDQASRRMLQAMLEVSKVLTPEQRAKLGERMKQRSEMMRERMQRMERERPKQ